MMILFIKPMQMTERRSKEVSQARANPFLQELKTGISAYSGKNLMLRLLKNFRRHIKTMVQNGVSFMID